MLIGQRYELLPAGRVRESVEHTFAAHRTRDAFLAQPLRARAGPSPHPQLMARLNLLLRSRYAATCCARIRGDDAEKTVRDQTSAFDGCHVLDILLGP
ncbi:hypothetical protein [Paraburkholderia atlantica]|uniref:hypothetical protein n=1 Tax=Paraburkholderia atlantica TaxID=2654982 RepID=UPI001622DA04|nr:hypothetical protein [Paraburkholderia atlantica]MBB5415533.1 hypothetical protein [Paraburkholderia atlantica]